MSEFHVQARATAHACNSLTYTTGSHKFCHDNMRINTNDTRNLDILALLLQLSNGSSTDNKNIGNRGYLCRGVVHLNVSCTRNTL